MPNSRIVSARHVGKTHTHRTIPADIAPKLCAVGYAEAKEHIRAAIEPVTARDDDDLTVLGGDDASGDLGTLRCVCPDR